nr:hypothetical protein BgiMline_010715 [Biomphalaria glabrata]
MIDLHASGRRERERRGEREEIGEGGGKRSYRGAYYFQKPDLIVTNFQIERDLLKLLMNFEILQQIEEQILSAST